MQCWVNCCENTIEPWQTMRGVIVILYSNCAVYCCCSLRDNFYGFEISFRLHQLKMWVLMQHCTVVKPSKNKYAIYAYTHGPVTGSALVWLFGACISHGAKGPSLLPPSSSLIQPMWISRPPIGVGREKNRLKCKCTPLAELWFKPMSQLIQSKEVWLQTKLLR